MAWVLEVILLMVPCACLVLTSQDNLTVFQSPSKLQLRVHQSVEIICSWNISSDVEQFRVEWKKSYHIQGNVTQLIERVIKNNLYKSFNFTPETRKEPLILEKLKINDSGFYFCDITIEIPIRRWGKGNGTHLIVKEDDEKSEWFSWALALFLLILTLSACLCYCSWKKRMNSKKTESKSTDQEERSIESVYIEMKKKTEEDRRTPSNTTEWAISVLYEPMTSFAKKPDEQKDENIYTLICSDSLPELNPNPSVLAVPTTPDDPETPRGSREGRSLRSQIETE